MLETIREYARERMDTRGEAETLCPLHADYYLALAEDAKPRLQGQEQAAKIGDRARIAATLVILAREATEHDDDERAESLAGEALELHRSMGAEDGISAALVTLSRVAARRGELYRASEMLDEALKVARSCGDADCIADVFDALAELSVEEARPERAGWLSGAAAGVRTEATLVPASRPRLQHALDRARRELGEVTFEAAVQAGKHVAQDEVAIGSQS